MKTLILASLLALSAVSGVVVTTQSAQAGSAEIGVRPTRH